MAGIASRSVNPHCSPRIRDKRNLFRPPLAVKFRQIRPPGLIRVYRPSSSSSFLWRDAKKKKTKAAPRDNETSEFICPYLFGALIARPLTAR